MKRGNEKKGRLFVFIDETGDPGYPGFSSIFQYNILVIDQDGLKKLEKNVSEYRYFVEHYGELKTKNNRKNSRLNVIPIKLVDLGICRFFVFYIEKEDYMGPYLKKIGGWKFDSTKFRNFILRKSLECLFGGDQDLAYREIELVIDRYAEKIETLRNVQDYLWGNIRLPDFLHITFVDSRYSNPLQLLDVVGKIVADTGYGTGVDWVHVKKLDTLHKRKGPDVSYEPGT